MKCPQCDGSMRMQVQAVVSAPADLSHNFTKQNLRRSDVHVMGVLWETADYICENAQCGYVINGYGNYVTGLKKENEGLRAALAAKEEK